MPLETFYYESYNQSNVDLIDIKENPIECITPKGIKTSDKEYEFDMIIYATGFDAVTGSFNAMDIQGTNGQTLKEKWKEHGIETYLGLMVAGFPNMLMVMGPHTALGNIPRSIEFSVDWLTGVMRYVRDHKLTRLEATGEAEDEWTEHVKSIGKQLLSNDVDSWMTGVNSNVEGKQTRIVARYSGSAAAYRARCNKIAENDYKEMLLA